MRRISKRAASRRKSLSAVAGEAIEQAAIAAARVVIRNASKAVQSADRALYGDAAGGKLERKIAKPKAKPQGKNARRARSAKR
jgi:hypothetical protein